MTAEQPPKILNDFEKAMNDLLGDHSEDLELLKDIPNIQHALVQHEVRILDKTLGKDHPRVRNLRSNLEHNASVIKSFSPDLEMDDIETNEISQDAFIMGRLVDEKNIAMAGMTVDVEDESGRKIPYLGGVKTDDAGNFILRIDSQNVDKVKNKVGGTGYLTVRDHKGKVVHQDAAPLRPDKGGQMSMNVAVSTEKFSGKEKVLKPRGSIPRSPIGDLRKGSPGAASLDGKGDNGIAPQGTESFYPKVTPSQTPVIIAPSMGEESMKPAEFKDITITDEGSRMGISKASDLIGEAMAAKGEQSPKEFGREKGTAKAGIGLGGARMDEDDEGEEDVATRVMAGKGSMGKGGDRMDDDEGEEDVQSIGMRGKGSMRDVPPDVPPGPMPKEVDKKSEKKGFFRKGKGTSEMSAAPDDMVEGAGKKMGRKEKRGRGKQHEDLRHENTI